MRDLIMVLLLVAVIGINAYVLRRYEDDYWARTHPTDDDEREE